MSTYSRLIRFKAKSSSTPLIGQPRDPKQDVGLASYAGEPIEVDLYSGSSILAPGEPTGESAVVGTLLSPLAAHEVGTIRCIGLNYVRHAKEVNMALPEVPVLFMKPSTALADPFPAPTILPKAFLKDNSADYESELAIVIGKDAKNVSEADALDYLLGFTASNDVSSRVQQFAQSQWSYSKSFDGACPIGPAFVHKSAVESIADLKIRGSYNDKTVQESGLDDLIFSVPKIISFLSTGTTLPAGTIILTGTPAGVGWSSEPRITLKNGDEFRVFVSHGVGTLINKIVEEK
ncbi:putative mitochondrion protein [Leucosporidium creatinivorum]|uniref:Putative mitochondrion protein n=1 Tax=Leucosporidium creatinivorum TaxID=106004 RepID=A0A1Y2EPV2_9BASI|nr:putative mitochondrion protein [Leucosporidium creatinivorum]